MTTTVAPPVGDRRAKRSVAAIAHGHRMQRVARRPTLGRYVAQLWRRREFIWTYAASRLSATNSRDHLGSLWLILTPLMSGALYYLVFGFVLNTRAGIENFVGFLVIGIFLFQFFSRTVTEGARVVPSNRKLIQALDFPAASLPLSIVTRQLLAVGPAIAAMLAIVLFATPAVPTWRWLLLAPIVALLSLFALGVSMLLGRLVAGVNDLVNLLPFVLRAWLYLSGVFFSVDRFAGQPTIQAVFEANPMHIFLTAARDAVLYQTTPDTTTWLTLCAWTAGALLVGFVVFWHAEERYGRE